MLENNWTDQESESRAQAWAWRTGDQILDRRYKKNRTKSIAIFSRVAAIATYGKIGAMLFITLMTNMVQSTLRSWLLLLSPIKAIIKI